MKISRKIQNYGLIIIAEIAFFGLLIGSFLDKEIATKMGDSNNLLGIIFTAFGPVLTLAFGVLAGSLLFFMPKLENKDLNVGLRILGAAAVIGFIFSQIKEGFKTLIFLS